MLLRKTAQSNPCVIVRAWGDEPVVLVAHGLESAKNRVLVGKPEAMHPISLPTDDVFDYEESRFTRLVEAYQKADSAGLRGLYEELRQNKNVKTYCDTCCNVVNSLHEKPKVTNSRSVAERGEQ